METGDVISDAALIRLAAAGDGDGFKALMRGHCGRLLRGARALCGDHQQSEDLVQETLLEAWRGLERFDGRCQFSTWFVKQVVGRLGSRCMNFSGLVLLARVTGSWMRVPDLGC